MALGRDNPTWKQLFDVLAKLASDCGGVFAFVVDEGNGLWCVGIPTPPQAIAYHAEELADGFYRDVVAPRMGELRRGGKIDTAKLEDPAQYVALSFASIYVAVVWFDGDFDPFTARMKTRRALPIIESLIVALPPPGGPSAGEGAGGMRA